MTVGSKHLINEADGTWTAEILEGDVAVKSKGGCKTEAEAKQEVDRLFSEYQREKLAKFRAEKAKQIIEDERAKQTIKDATKKHK